MKRKAVWAPLGGLLQDERAWEKLTKGWGGNRERKECEVKEREKSENSSDGEGGCSELKKSDEHSDWQSNGKSIWDVKWVSRGVRLNSFRSVWNTLLLWRRWQKNTGKYTEPRCCSVLCEWDKCQGVFRRSGGVCKSSESWGKGESVPDLSTAGGHKGNCWVDTIWIEVLNIHTNTQNYIWFSLASLLGDCAW